MVKTNQYLSFITEKLKQKNISYIEEAYLSQFTTIGIGGKADLIAIIENHKDLEFIIKLVTEYALPYLVLGKGSNLIFSDTGYRGIILLNHCRAWTLLDTNPIKGKKTQISSRFKSLDHKVDSDPALDYMEQNVEEVLVRVESGIRISTLMKEMFKIGLTGLQWFAGIPATVGGALFMNMHGGDKYFGDLLYQASITDGICTKVVERNYFQFDYDWSILHETHETVLYADILLQRGNVKKAKDLVRSWATYKADQPQKSAGCIFQNLSQDDQKMLNLPTNSIGYFIDKILKLRGMRRGDAVISTQHAAFIENLGNAKASDVLQLIELIKERAWTEYGIELKTEVQLIGEFKI
jgi:UDP-N-acetylmuramate dehydrogenase